MLENFRANVNLVPRVLSLSGESREDPGDEKMMIFLSRDIMW